MAKVLKQQQKLAPMGITSAQYTDALSRQQTEQDTPLQTEKQPQLHQKITAEQQSSYSPHSQQQLDTELTETKNVQPKAQASIEPRSEKEAIQSHSRIAQKLAKHDKTATLLNAVKQDRINAMNEVGAKMGKRKNITLTINDGKNRINLNFDSDKQVNAFLKELAKNNRNVTVTDNKGKVLFDPKMQQQLKDKLKPDIEKDVAIRDGSEVGKIAFAEQNVGEFDAAYEGAAEHRLDIKFEPQPELTKEAPQASENKLQQLDQEIVVEQAIDNFAEVIEQINQKEKSLLPEPKPEPRLTESFGG